MKNMKRIIKAVVLLALLAFCVTGLSELLILKWTDKCHESIVFTEFYEMEPDSAEVCFVGNSQIFRGISAMRLYSDYGISGYSLGSALQPAEASYALVREFDRKQDLKLVVMDIGLLFEEVEESRYRQVYDNMELSRNKLQTVFSHCREYPEADPLISYLFPIIKYHSRWQELDQTDYGLDYGEYPIFRGNYTGLTAMDVKLSKVAYDQDKFNPKEAMVPEQVKYFEQIVEWCDQAGVELLLIKTPKSEWNISKHTLMEEYAREHELTFLDFSSQAMIEELGLKGDEDFSDPDHLNILGAEKLSSYLGTYLDEHYSLTDFREKEKYDDMEYSLYLDMLEDAQLGICSDIQEYFELLKKDRYEILAYTAASATEFTEEELDQGLKSLGAEITLSEIGKADYAVLLSKGKSLYEKKYKEGISFRGAFADGTEFRVEYNAESGETLLQINHRKQTFSMQGLHIYVYDSTTGRMVERRTFYQDEETKDLTCFREDMEKV